MSDQATRDLLRSLLSRVENLEGEVRALGQKTQKASRRPSYRIPLDERPSPYELKTLPQRG